MRVSLLVISDANTTRRVSDTVPADCWKVYGAELGSDSLSAVQILRPSTVILDARASLPNLAEFSRTIRSIGRMVSVPIIALVSPDHSDRLRLLESGADDCWTDSIDSPEFLARLMNIHRRIHRSKGARIIQRGEIELNLDRFTVQAGGAPAQLTILQVKVLTHLMENAGVVVTRKEMLEHSWPNPDLDEGAVRTFVGRLRQVLAAIGIVNVIRSASGGYVFETGSSPIKVSWNR